MVLCSKVNNMSNISRAHVQLCQPSQFYISKPVENENYSFFLCFSFLSTERQNEFNYSKMLNS